MTQTVSGFENIHNQQSPINEIKTLLQSDTLPNAILFTGNESSKINETALFFSKAANCTKDSANPCGSCISCKKIEQGVHPDILFINTADKKNITISQIREIGSRLSIKANEARVRTVILPHAEKMNIPAQNAMLKMLEEPPDRTVFLLFAPKVTDMLPTIQSRCRKIGCIPPDRASIEAYLTGTHEVAPDMARIISRTCGENLEKALMLLDLQKDATHEPEGGWIEHRRTTLHSLFFLLGAVDQIPRYMSRCLLLVEHLTRKPELLGEMFMILRTFFRDLSVFRHAPQDIINTDFFDSFEDICAKRPYNDHLDWIKGLFEAQRKIEANASARLTLERFFLQLPPKGM